MLAGSFPVLGMMVANVSLPSSQCSIFAEQRVRVSFLQTLIKPLLSSFWVFTSAV
jgi:hypothetical protein